MTASRTDNTPKGLAWSRTDLYIILILAFLCVAFFWFIITPKAADRGSFVRGDFDEQFYAFELFAARELSQGRLPLWNPYAYAGHPFQADIQAAVFYPPTLLMILSSFLWGFSLLTLEWQAILHFFLASVFTYLFLRHLLVQRGSALLSAVVFTYGGYLTSYPSQQLAILESATWLPLILMFLDMGFEVLGAPVPQSKPLRRYRPLVVAGLAWGLSLLAGHPQTAMYIFYTTALYAIFCAWRFRVNWPRAIVGFGLFQVLGFGLAAIHLVPGIEYMHLSTRAQMTYAEVSGGFPRQDILQLLLPGSVSLYSPLYIGILPLLLAILAPVLRRTPQVLFWSSIAMLSLVLSFGGNTFVYSLFYLIVPGFALFRSQERAAFIFSFSLAVLAGHGALYLLHPLAQSQRRAFERFFRVVIYLLLGSLAFVALAFYGWLDAGWSPKSPFGAALTRAVLLTLLLTFSLIILWLRRNGRLRGNNLSRLMIVLIIFDLFTINSRNNLSDLPPDDHWQPTPLIAIPTQDPEIFRLYNEWQLPGNYGCIYNLEETWGASPLRLQTYDALFKSVPIERVWELLNVKYVITWRKTLAPPSERLYEEPKGQEKSYLHRLAQVRPRAYVVYAARIADDQTALKYLADPNTDPFQEAVVNAPLPFSLAPPPMDRPAKINFVERLPGRLLIDASLPTDGLLVLSEVYYPGWIATVDGKPAPIYRAQVTLRALPLRAGNHHIVMEFRPPTFTWGVSISGVTLLVVTGLLWAGKRR